MNRFNLTFWGEIIPGHDEARVKARFAKLFAIDDPERVEHFFSGQTIILRRNLERKVAAEYFAKLRKVGVEAELVKVDTGWVESSAPSKVREVTAERDRRQEQARPDSTDEAPPEMPPEDEAQRRAAEEKEEAEAEAAAIRWAEGKRRRQQKAAEEKARQERAEQEAAEKAAREKAQREEAERRAEQERLQQQKAAEEQARREQAEREAAEKAAREKARQEEAERRAAAEAEARRKAEQKRLQEQKAAEEKARREQAEREAAEKAAREKARREEAERRAAAEAEARRKAEQKRLQEQKAAEEKARREEARRKAAEEKARRKAEQEEARRKAAAEKARRREAERQLKEQQAAEERERREQARLEAAEQAAREKARQEEENRKAAEEKARIRAEQEQQRRKAAEQEARRQAREKRQREEARRKAAEEKARREEEKRQAAEELARQKAQEKAEQEAEQRARAAEQRRRKAEARRKAREAAAAEREKKARARQETAARLAQEKAARELEQKRQQEEAAQRRAEQQRQREQEQAQREASEAEQEAQRLALEEQAVQRAARALAQQPSVQAVKGGVKSSLNLPRRQNSPASGRIEPGAPNLYSLQPFRNSPEIRGRAEAATTRKRKALRWGTLALAALLLLAGRYLSLPEPQLISGPQVVLADPQNRLLIVAGRTLLFHDRAGLGTTSIDTTGLGVSSLSAPLDFTATGELLAMGTLLQTAEPTASGIALLSCSREPATCTPLYHPGAEEHVSSIAAHPLTGEVFITDSSGGRLLKLSPSGALLLQQALDLPPAPVIRLESGLLFMNSPHGPAISVFRYEQNAFGQQLDEILLLPPEAVEQEQSQVTDFVFSAGNWWVVLSNPESGKAGLYRYDSQWSYLGPVALPDTHHPGQLLEWGEKTLVVDHLQLDIQRYNATGKPEVPLRSDLLAAMVSAQNSSQALGSSLWHLALLVSLLLTLACFGTAWLQAQRALVFHKRPTRGAEPVDNADSIHWIKPVTDCQQKMNRAVTGYCLLAVAFLLIAIGLGVSVIQLTALLVALTGPLLTLALLRRQSPGHLGVMDDQLALVDHQQRYHLGGGPRIQYRGPFLLIDDVVLFTGVAGWPVLDAQQLAAQVAPLARAGIRVDRKTVAVKLLECHHPLATGAQLTLGCFALALALLTLQGLW